MPRYRKGRRWTLVGSNHIWSRIAPTLIVEFEDAAADRQAARLPQPVRSPAPRM